MKPFDILWNGSLQHSQTLGDAGGSQNSVFYESYCGGCNTV